MKNEINLLPQKKTGARKSNKQVRLLRMLTIGSLVVIVGLSVGVFLITALSPLPGLKKDEEQKAQEFAALRLKTTKYVLTQERLTSASELLSKRVDYAKIIRYLTSEQIPDLVYSSVKFSQGNVQLTVSSPSLSSVKGYIDLLKAKNDQKLFKGLALSELRFDDQTNVYTVTVSVNL